jgi:hypothetical protein
MRIVLLCSVALLGAAGAVDAQAWPGPQGYYGPSQGYYPVGYNAYANAGYVNNAYFTGYGYGNNYPAGYAAGQNQPYNYVNGYYQFPAYQPPVPAPAGAPPEVSEEGSRFFPGDEYKGKPSWCWASVEYAWSFIRSPAVNVPLVSTTSQLGGATPGAIGSAGTQVLFGTNVSYTPSSMFRGELGAFIDEDCTLSVEANLLWLLPNHEHFSRSSDATGSPPILRPAFNVVSGTEIALIDALPSIASGRTDVDSRSDMFGLELNTRCHYCLLENQWYVDGLAGFRYLRFAETLRINDSLQPFANSGLTFLGPTNPIPEGSNVTDYDSFQTVNKFYGAQIGGRMRFEGPWWLVHLYGKTALGVTDQEVHVNGQSRLVNASTNSLASGGVLALPSNIGTSNLTQLGFVPEVGLNVGFKIHQCVMITAGYNFLFWSQVVRPADIIDRNVNATTIPTAAAFGTSNSSPFRPLTNVNGESFWVHSLSLRLAVAF